MTLTEDAVQKLREALLQGEVFSGTTLTERQVGAYLGMSRTPIRAALQTLANEGLLAYAPQRGYSLRRISARAVQDAYRVRAVLEGLACHTIAEQGLTPETETALARCVAEGRALLNRADAGIDLPAWRDMNSRFHHALADAADNAPLADALLRVERLPMASFKMIASIGAHPDRTLLDGAQRDHEQILTSLRAGHGARAAARMQEHVLVAGDLIGAALRRKLGA